MSYEPPTGERPDLQALARRFMAPQARAIVLVGSHARNDAGPFSDVDLWRLLRPETQTAPDAGTHFIDGRLVVVCDILPADVEQWFTDPATAAIVIQGVRDAKPLIDPDGYFGTIQQRATAFIWDEPMQQKANVWAGQQMVGWIEEVFKGLEGLRRNDIGRLLNARIGLSWGLSKTMQVHRGVLLTGDNGFFDEMAAAMGVNSRWTTLRNAVFGVSGSVSLRDQVVAGLELYALTAKILSESVSPDHRQRIDHAVAAIRAELSGKAEQGLTAS